MMKRLLLLSFLFPAAALAQAANCTFSPAAGTYSGTQTVTLSSTTTGAVLFYTTDGTAATIASTEYTGPVTVSTTQTLNCIAAVVDLDAIGEQTTSPTATGTFWKTPVCAQFTGSGPGNCTSNNPGPGGSGVPTAPVVSTNGITSPSLSGNAWKFSFKNQLSTQTNVLQPQNGNLGGSDSDVYYYQSWNYYWAGGFTNHETDGFHFCVACIVRGGRTRFMKGTQFNGSSHCWQYGGNSNVPWTNYGSGVCNVGNSLNTWHSFATLWHRVASELTSLPCNDGTNTWPYLYIDYIVIDGVTYNNGGPGWKFCANNTTFNKVVGGWQLQGDIDPNGSSVTGTDYYDNINSRATQQPSTNVSATFTISGAAAPPTQFRGKAVFAGNNTIQ